MKQVIMLTGLCALLMTSSVVFAEDVYATKNGKKYHKESCEYIKDRGANKIDKEQAVKKNLKPCGACYADKSVKLEKK